MGDKEKKPTKAPSEEFLDAFTDSTGSIRGECGFCGRTYFDCSSYGFDEGEHEDLKKKAQEQPDKFIEWDGGPSFATVNGTQYVIGCECWGPRLYEDWIWANRWMIAKYLKTRAQGILSSAKQIYEATDDLPRLIDLSTRHAARKVEQEDH